MAGATEREVRAHFLKLLGQEDSRLPGRPSPMLWEAGSVSFEGHTGQIRLWGTRVLWTSPGVGGW